ncbi:MAG: glycoside hydrolase family 5 protein, partial [Anaerolineae bacterium]
PSNQTRLINLWRAIAQRYANEPTIAAYDLLNEPNPTSSASQWQTLAQQIVDAIRQVDQNHLIIVERVNWIFAADGTSPLADWSLELLSSFQVSVNDDNVMYDFHFYDPGEYALQNEGAMPDDGNYPDEAANQTAKDGSTMPRNKNYLAYELNLEARFNEPMFVGEWGPNPSTFNSVKGGYTYIRDVLDLSVENNLHWTYYVMNNLYNIECCYEDNPTTPNTELINVFTDFFTNPGTPLAHRR